MREWAKPMARVVLQDLHSHSEMSAKWARLPNVPNMWEFTLFQVGVDEFCASGNYLFYLIPDQRNLFFITIAENGQPALLGTHLKRYYHLHFHSTL